jgi:hypothetical protein
VKYVEPRRQAPDLLADAWLGFDSRQGRLLAGEVTRTGEVEPGGFVGIVSRPQVHAFRGERLFVHQPIASSFVIHSVRVQCREALVASCPIPADAFATRMDALAQMDEMFARDKVIEVRVGRTAAELLGSPLTLPTALVGDEIMLSVENIGGAPLRFLAGMLGKVPPP